MTVNYKVGKTKYSKEFKDFEMTETRGRSLFHSSQYSITGITPSGERVVLKSGLSKGKAKGLYSTILMKQNSPFWFGGAINV